MVGETIKAEIRETENKQKEENTPTKRIRKERGKKRERERQTRTQVCAQRVHTGTRVLFFFLLNQRIQQYEQE